MAKRKRYFAEFKADVALDALRGEETMAQLAAKYGVHANMISQWKAKIQEGAIDVFSSGKARKTKSHEDEVKELHAKIGQLTVVIGVNIGRLNTMFFILSTSPLEPEEPNFNNSWDASC